MKTASIVLGAIALIALFFGGWLMSSYNSMITQQNQVDNAWAKVETQYERRFALIPNLVNSVKAVLKQEQTVFGDIAEARTRYAGAKASGSQESQTQAFGQYESAIGRLLVIMENYPELKSYAQVQSLMDELAGTENRVLVARNDFNTEATSWNINISRFPRNILASMFGFDKRTLFASQEGANQVPGVEFNLN